MEQFRNLRVVVTGGAGFIGSHLVEKLLALGAEVIVIDNFLFGNKIEHLSGHRNLSVYEGDVRDIGIVSSAIKDSALVFHLAAVLGVEYAQMHPLDVLDVEIQGTRNILAAAAEHGIKRMIVASSSEVYGDSPEVMNEDGSFPTRSAYATAKLIGEEYCKAFHRKYGMEYTCLRYFNVYGPRQDERFVIPHFVKMALSSEPILIYGDGRQTRDFTYIDDAVNMTLLAGIKPEARCQAINVGTGTMTTINEVASLIAKALDSKNPVKSVYVDYNDKRPRTIEVFTRCAGTTKAINLLQYEPEITLASGIEKYINRYLKKQTEGKLS
ncbi:MAG: UDP-N-acetylglucosamine 4-epimerase [Syntrophomonadaceae bacterium]|nr:UDP-N-acetylglucosamine 4-epimerase [Bacillota bacterium]MBT9147711.1 UDP-N-acetylglucosamine 4-epimerase [Bacillota bacterium]